MLKALVSSLSAGVLLVAAHGDAQVRLSGPDACRGTVSEVRGDVTIVCEGVSLKALASLNRQLKAMQVGVDEQVARANRWAAMYKDLRSALSGAALKNSLLKDASKALEAGDLPQAEALLRQAVSRMTSDVGATARAEAELGNILVLQFREHEAVLHLETAYRLVPDSLDFGEAYASALSADGRERDARRVYETMLRRHAEPSDSDAHRKLAVTEALLAEAEFDAKELDSAESHFRSALSRLRNFDDRQAQEWKTSVRSALISIYLHSNREAKAEELIRAELQAMPNQKADFMRVAELVLRVQLAQAIVGKDSDEAIALSSKAIETMRTMEKAIPAVAEYIHMAEIVLAEARLNNDDAAGAERVLLDATARADRLIPKTPADREFILRAWELYGDAAVAQDRFGEAVERYRRSIAYGEKFIIVEDGYAERYGGLLVSLGAAQIRADDGEGAEETLLHALGVFDLMKTQKMVARGTGRLQNLIALARLYALTSVLDQARKAYKDAIEEIRATLGEDSKYMPRAMIEMGDFELQFAKNTAEGCRLLSDALRHSSLEPDDRQRATTTVESSCSLQ